MQRLLEKIREILRNKRIKVFFTRTVSLTAAIVVFITTYALVLPAITLEKTASCGIEEHQHNDSCYEDILICGREESDGHHHDDSCYTVTRELKCGLGEHQHSAEDGCYDEEGNLICQISEHSHDDSCYSEVKTLTCGLQESEGHHHTDACYEKVLVCGKEVHTHSETCYTEDGGADDQNGNAGNGSSSEALPQEPAPGSDDAVTESIAATAEAAAEEVLPEGYVPELEPLNMEAVLGKKTGFYYFHAEEGQEVPSDSAEITDWQKVRDDTELKPTDLVKMYLPYSIPAGSLNETNPTARYRLPGNIHLTDDQIKAINKNENGITAGLSESEPEYRKYLGVEAVEGDRTPDQLLQDGMQEYISAVVRAENVYEQDKYIGQDLIFTFVPYTIEKNQKTYDAEQNPLSAGEKVTGWFACDFRLDQIDWIEEEKQEETQEEVQEDTQEIIQDESEETDQGADYKPDNEAESVSADENSSNITVITIEKTADILFVSEDKDEDIQEIRCTLKQIEKKEITVSEEEKEEEKEEYQSGTLTAEGDGYKITLDYSEEAKIPENASLSVREITAETDKEAYEACLAQAQQHVDESGEVKSTVDSRSSRFFDIEIQVENEDGTRQKIEPAAPVSVNIQIADVSPDSSGSESGSKGEQNSDPTVLHFAEEGVEQIEATASAGETDVENGASESDVASGKDTNTDSSKESKGESEGGETTEIRFEAESFSIYGVVYTVDFHWEVNGEEYELSIPGGGFVSFTELVEVLGVIDGTHKGENIAENEAAQSIPNELNVSDTTREFVADVANVEFSSPELLSVSKVEKDTTVGRIKEELHLECEYSLELTDEQIKTINEGEVKAGDWALISLKAFDTEETLTITMNNGEVFVIKVTDDQENPLGLDGKTFSILGQKNNTQYYLNNTVTSSNTLSATAVNSSTSRGTPWTFEWTGTGKNYLIHDNDGKYIIIQDDRKVTLTTDRNQALDNPITVNSINGKYSFVNKNNIGLNIYGDSGFGGWPYSTSNNDFMMTLQSPEDLKRPGTIATADSSDGITINLFDYGPEDQLDTVDHHNGNPADAGVNIGHTLKFFSYGHDVGTGINDFTGSGNGAQVGIVNDRLGSDNYPVLAESGESLNYLFGGVSNQYVTGYYGLNHLFTKDEDEYYHYDSDTNYAYYDSSNGNRDFKVYSKTFPEEGADEQYFAVGFFPFNDYDEHYNCIHGINFNWDSDTSRQGHYNHHFGMEMKAEFTYLPGGQYNGNDISYHFSGDDDMWVFVDGILVMDIGGIHNPVAGDINFRTGEVTVHGSSQENFKDKYKRITGKDWDDSDYSTHDFRVFYMERGGMYSNLEVEFNLPTFKTIAVEKQMEGLTEEQRELYKDVEFKYELLLNGELYNGNQTVRQDKNGDVIEKGFEISNGEISIKDGEVVAITHLTRQDVFSVSEKNLDMSQYNVPNAERVHLDDNGERITEDITLTETTAHYQPVEGRKTWISGTYNAAETEKVTIKNKPLLGSLRIDKKVTYNGAAPVSDEEKALLAGTYVFKIFKDEDCTIPYKENGEDKTISITINNDGTAQSSELVSLLEGVYWIQEETPDNGAAPIQNKFEVSVTTSHTTSAPAIVTFTNNIEGEVSIDIYKIDKSDNTKKLSGAVFTLRKIADKDPISEGTYGSEEGFDPIESEPTAEGTGKTGFANLKSGYYELTEKTPPAGYIKTEDLAVYFKIKNGKVIWLEKGSGKPSTWEEKTEDTMVSFEAAKDDENASFSVKNEPGAVLPNAGGPGTKLFTILGSILILGAGVLLWRRRRLI